MIKWPTPGLDSITINDTKTKIPNKRNKNHKTQNQKLNGKEWTKKTENFNGNKGYEGKEKQT